MGERTVYQRLAGACAVALALSALVAAVPEPAAATVPSDSWHLDAVRAAEAWTTATGEGVTVAVIDSGVDAAHPALADAVLPGRNLVDGGDEAAVPPIETAAEAAATGVDDADRPLVGRPPADGPWNEPRLGEPKDGKPLDESEPEAPRRDFTDTAEEYSLSAEAESHLRGAKERRGGLTDGVLRRLLGHRDPVGHGTAVAGLIAARADSQRPGVAPDAVILPVRVLDDDNRYHDSAVVGEAVVWAVDNGADVINLSLGGNYESPAFAAALEYAAANDVVVIACTGNESAGKRGPVWFPARHPAVLAVTGVGPDGRRWSTAVTGPETAIAAPAARLPAIAPGGRYGSVTGTSFGAAVVSGAAALVRSAHPDATADEVTRMLTATAVPSSADLGAGVVDAAAAVAVEPSALAPASFEVSTVPAETGLWPLAATAASGSLLGAAALLLRPRRIRVGGPGLDTSRITSEAASRPVARRVRPGSMAG